MPGAEIVAGWDIGGAHVKLAIASRDAAGHESITVDQWPCALWLGLDRLDAVLAQALAQRPRLARAHHAVTMTGEMVDLFEHREAGVLKLAELLEVALGASLSFWAGPHGGPAAEGWCTRADLPRHWAAVASANWLATATLAARRLAERSVMQALLIDIGSTTTDVIALQRGQPQAQGRNDAERLASGELLYQGVVRTPLCALAPRITHRGRRVNVMNEFFATTADVHRLLGDLDPEHDQQPAADGGPKDLASTRRRLARMVGEDARDMTEADLLALAAAWRDAQHAALHETIERVASAAGLARDAPIVAAGCGDFVALAVARLNGRPALAFDALVAGEASGAGSPRDADVVDGADLDDRGDLSDRGDSAEAAEAALRRGLQLGAPAVAVALLRRAAEPLRGDAL